MILMAQSTTLFLFLLAIWAAEADLPMDVQMKLITYVGPKCAQENNMSEEDFMQYIRNMIPPTRRNKCFCKCVAQKLDIMDAKGAITAETFFKNAKIAAEDANLFRECLGPSFIKDDACETAYEIASCLRPKLNPFMA